MSARRKGKLPQRKTAGVGGKRLRNRCFGGCSAALIEDISRACKTSVLVFCRESVKPCVL